MQISFRRNSRHLLNRKLSFSCTLVNPVTKISSTWYFRFSLVTQWGQWGNPEEHYDDVIMDAIASQITSLTIVYSNVYSGADQSKHQSSASLAFVWGIHRGPVNSPHKWPVTRKMFPFDDVIMNDTQTGCAIRMWCTHWWSLNKSTENYDLSWCQLYNVSHWRHHGLSFW